MPKRQSARQKNNGLSWALFPVSQDAGTIMYSNRFCTGKYRYLTSEEVRKATNEEMTPYHEEQRRKRRSRYLQSKKEREQAIRYGELLSLCDQQRQLDEENYRGTIPTLRCPLTLKQRAWILTRMKYFKFQFWILTPGKFCWTAM